MAVLSQTAIAPPVTRTMRASVITGPGQVEVEHVVIPEPGPGEVRLRMEGCGVCGSNLSLWEGHSWFEYPSSAGAPGHEGWGVIDAVGSGVSSLTPGDRVTALSYRAFSEYDIAAADAVVPLPASLANTPFPGEPLGCAVNAFRRSGIYPGQTVAIIGIGFLGALLTRLSYLGGARVIAISRRPFALAVAKRLGAEISLPLEDRGSLTEQVRQLTGGKGVDTAIEAVGLEGPLNLAAELTRIRGRLVIAGYHQGGSRQVNLQLWNWRGLDVINAHERDPAVYLEGIREAVNLVLSGALDPAPLYTHRFALDRLDEAFATMQERPDGYLKALVLP
ncbi:MAG: MDR/zinc-dependent alcohol dehydrogenase-like family protein [Gemmatimonadales bacterium]